MAIAWPWDLVLRRSSRGRALLRLCGCPRGLLVLLFLFEAVVWVTWVTKGVRGQGILGDAGSKAVSGVPLLLHRSLVVSLLHPRAPPPGACGCPGVLVLLLLAGVVRPEGRGEETRDLRRSRVPGEL